MPFKDSPDHPRTVSLCELCHLLLGPGDTCGTLHTHGMVGAGLPAWPALGGRGLGGVSPPGAGTLEEVMGNSENVSVCVLKMNGLCFLEQF